MGMYEKTLSYALVLVERRESERLLFRSTRRSSAVVSQGSLKSLEFSEGTWEPKIVSGISFSSMISISFKVDPLKHFATV